MEIPTLNCSICTCPVDPYDVTYHTADRLNVFCSAQCSLDWHMKEKDDRLNKSEHQDST